MPLHGRAERVYGMRRGGGAAPIAGPAFLTVLRRRSLRWPNIAKPVAQRVAYPQWLLSEGGCASVEYARPILY
eukprot:gene8722-13522_t